MKPVPLAHCRRVAGYRIHGVHWSPRMPASPCSTWSIVLLVASLGCAPDTKNRIDACPVERSFDETAVSGSILYCEDVDGETCYGDGCDCNDRPPRVGSLRVLVEVSPRAELGQAVVCYDDVRRAELEAGGQRNPGFPFLFAYASEALTPDAEVVLWSTDYDQRGEPSEGDGCWGRRSLTLDANGVASTELTDRDMGSCQ